MKRSGGRAGRPFAHLSVVEIEKHLKDVTSMSDLQAIRAELGFRTTKRSKVLQSLVARLIRVKTDSFNPHRH